MYKKVVVYTDFVFYSSLSHPQTHLPFSFLIIICKLMFYDICNSSGTFIKASDDTTGILDNIEEKIAQFTMLPRQNGEVTIFFFLGKNRIWIGMC